MKKTDHWRQQRHLARRKRANARKKTNRRYEGGTVTPKSDDTELGWLGNQFLNLIRREHAKETKPRTHRRQNR